MHKYSMNEKSKVVEALQQVFLKLNFDSYKIEITDGCDIIHVLIDRVYTNTVQNIDSITQILANSNSNLKISFVDSFEINTL